ncbi:SDR family NAD(P)-dependent oxidoreductase [Halomonas alkalisoli]|uniref:SDR family NAD(P)-dependent oxidoreductase n=1 Tax=Halomonas alkalisoli TaxID=2907158 RepID=UPI001F3D2A82|nr:SDR family oxidoreductase [Halomonas alkalisoli]MCE9682911.1 SDR family oxidoreductase [Halomonas alkalisoli]
MRIVAVIGAAGGIGAAICEAMLEAGEHVFLLDLDEHRESVASTLAAWGERASFVACDLADPDSITQAFAGIERHGQGLDACINAAGVIRRGRFVEVSREDLDTMMAVNVTGAFRALQAATRLMIASGGGRIVNIASAHGLRTTAERSAYAMSKGAILALTRALAVELGPHGILVNAVAPGPVATGMQSADSQSRRLWQASTPLGRVAEAEEIANAAAFLASPANTFITGDTLIVDGGASVSLG